MAKRQFLMLAHTYNPRKHFINNWYMSEKLDGQRAFFDGGLTRGLPASQVPWANIEKDHRLLNRVICTGLWSRYGKVLHAPDSWLDKLPNFFIDGELWIGRNSWQRLSSIVKRHDPDENDWAQVKFNIFDSPACEKIFADSVIDNVNYRKDFINIVQWVKDRNTELNYRVRSLGSNIFEDVIDKMKFLKIENDIVKIHEQIKLPNRGYEDVIENKLKEIVAEGSEGLVFRGSWSTWEPCRSYFMLKHKPFRDDEATVIGFTFGKKTESGSKHLGRIGALITSYKGKRLELAGLTDQERILKPKTTIINIDQYVEDNAGKDVNLNLFESIYFPLGSKVTFRYRELSDSGIPREARYLRKFEA